MSGLPLQDIQNLNKHIKSSTKLLKGGQEIELPPADKKPKPAMSGVPKNNTDLESKIAQSTVGSKGKQVLDQTATVAGYTGRLAEVAEPGVTKKLGELEKRVGDLRSNLPKLQSRVSGEERKAIDLLGSGKISKEGFSRTLASKQENSMTFKPRFAALKKR